LSVTKLMTEFMFAIQDTASKRLIVKKMKMKFYKLIGETDGAEHNQAKVNKASKDIW
jgi:hypothetical protein